MLDVEDFDAVFQGLSYTDGLVQRIQEYQHALGGQTFFERLLDLLKITGRKSYPPKTPQQLHDLHTRIITSTTTLHNKHCLIFYLLKDLSPQHHATSELATTFARNVHLEKRFWTFIEGLFALDRLEFATAVGNLTHPSIIPTFPDEIIFTLLTCREKLNSVNVQKGEQDEVLPLAYYNCVNPPLKDPSVRDAFASYLCRRNVPEMFAWLRTRPEHEQAGLLELMISQTLSVSVSSWSSGAGAAGASASASATGEVYTRSDRAMELIDLPFSTEEEAVFERFLTEGKGRSLRNASDVLVMRRIARGRLGDVVGELGELGGRGKRVGGVDWEVLRAGVERGLGPRGGGDGLAL